MTGSFSPPHKSHRWERKRWKTSLSASRRSLRCVSVDRRSPLAHGRNGTGKESVYALGSPSMDPGGAPPMTQPSSPPTACDHTQNVACAPVLSSVLTWGQGSGSFPSVVASPLSKKKDSSSPSYQRLPLSPRVEQERRVQKEKQKEKGRRRRFLPQQECRRREGVDRERNETIENPPREKKKEKEKNKQRLRAGDHERQRTSFVETDRDAATSSTLESQRRVNKASIQAHPFPTQALCSVSDRAVSACARGSVVHAQTRFEEETGPRYHMGMDHKFPPASLPPFPLDIAMSGSSWKPSYGKKRKDPPMFSFPVVASGHPSPTSFQPDGSSLVPLSSVSATGPPSLWIPSPASSPSSLSGGSPATFLPPQGEEPGEHGYWLRLPTPPKPSSSPTQHKSRTQVCFKLLLVLVTLYVTAQWGSQYTATTLCWEREGPLLVWEDFNWTSSWEEKDETRFGKRSQDGSDLSLVESERAALPRFRAKPPWMWQWMAGIQSLWMSPPPSLERVTWEEYTGDPPPSSPPPFVLYTLFRPVSPHCLSYTYPFSDDHTHVHGPWVLWMVQTAWSFVKLVLLLPYLYMDVYSVGLGGRDLGHTCHALSPSTSSDFWTKNEDNQRECLLVIQKHLRGVTMFGFLPIGMYLAWKGSTLLVRNLYHFVMGH